MHPYRTLADGINDAQSLLDEIAQSEIGQTVRLLHDLDALRQ